MPIPSSGGFFAPHQTHDSTSPYHTPPPPHSQPWPPQTHEWPPSSPFESPSPSTPYAPGGLVCVPEGAPTGYHGAHYNPYQPGYDTGTRRPHALARAETMPSSTHHQSSSSQPTVFSFGHGGFVSTEPQSYMPSASTVHEPHYTPQTYEQLSGTPEHFSQTDCPHFEASATVPHRSVTVWATKVEALLSYTDTGDHRAQPANTHSGRHSLPKRKPEKHNPPSNAQSSQQHEQNQQYHQQPPQPHPPYQYPPYHQSMPPRQR